MGDMEMTVSREINSQDEIGPGCPSGALTSPASVVRHPTMPLDEKRSILASWASDIRAVPDHPALRRLDNGCVIEIDDILDSLKQLDRSSNAVSSAHDGTYRRRRWSRLGRFWARRGDDDDDPPTPAPAAPRPRPPVLEGGVALAA